MAKLTKALLKMENKVGVNIGTTTETYIKESGKMTSKMEMEP